MAIGYKLLYLGEKWFTGNVLYFRDNFPFLGYSVDKVQNSAIPFKLFRKVQRYRADSLISAFYAFSLKMVRIREKMFSDEYSSL